MSPTAATDMAAVAEEESCIYALQLASLSILPMTLRGAIELGLLEVLEATRNKGGRDAAALAPAEVVARLPVKATNPDAPAMVDRMLRLLASYDVVRCETAPEEEGKDGGVVPRRYRAAPVCKWFAPDEDGVSLAPFVIMNLDKVSMASWYHLKDAVLHGGVPFDLAHGVNMFEHNEEDPGEFNEAMANHSVIVTRKLLDTCGDALFGGVGTLVDVGGGVGATLHAITSRYPRIEGINFDLPHVVAGAPPYPGVRHVGGDMFASAVPSGDAILMKWVIHNWSDDKCVALLRSCHAALPARGGGKVIVVESVLPEEPEPTREAQGTLNFDVMMLAQTPSGKERYEREFRELASAAGFAGFKLTYIYANACAIELTK